MWHKEDYKCDSDEKNDGGWKTSPHLILPLHLSCETVCGKDGDVGEGGDLSPGDAALKAIFAFLVVS